MTDIKRPFFLQLSNPRQHAHLSRNDNDDFLQQRHQNRINICDNTNERPPSLVARRPSKLKITRENWHNNHYDPSQTAQNNRQVVGREPNPCNCNEQVAKSGSSNWPCQDSRANQSSSTDSASSLPSHNIRRRPSSKRLSKCKTSSSLECNYEDNFSTSLKKNRYSANSVSSITSSSASSEFSTPNVSPAMSPTSSTSNESPSLILPYLYVGDQDQTQIDTISNLNISYILSLQSLPKFLAKHEPDSHSQDNLDSHIDTADVEVEAADTADDLGNSGLLPSINSSKDYLVKIKSTSVDSTSDEIMDVDEENSEVDQQEEPSADLSQNSALPHLERDQTHSIERSTHSDKNASNKQLQCQRLASSKQSVITSTSQSLSGRCNKISSKVQRLIRGKCINISDTFEQLLDKFFDEAHNFIEEARRNKCNILVHCKAGISRSPTIAIAYLMRWKRLHLQDAYNLVKRCRPQISPNLNFMGQLVSYERYLLCDRSKLSAPVSTNCPGPQTNDNNSSEEDKRKTYRSSETIRIAA